MARPKSSDAGPNADRPHLENLHNGERDPYGRLKIFLGYAAGVGKSYAMLQAAQQERDEGLDVVIGCIESPSYSETFKLMQGLETIPLVEVALKLSSQFEMDTDAIIKRRPQIAVVDELAHINAPGSRHARRFQDVLELLSSGINVYTTMNIQDLESLNDIVSRITGITIKETIPDHIFEDAQEIELVDIPISELLKRFSAGKVHIPGMSEQDLKKFFRPGNLIALREMALRSAAERVDEQMRAYMQAHALSGWPVRERVLVCIGPSPLSERLVRTTLRLARRLDAEWIAAYVETPGHTDLPEADQDRVRQTLKLAERLGAQTVRLAGHSVAETLVNYSLKRNVTKIVIGKPLRPRWREMFQGSIVDQVLRYSQDMDVYVISGKSDLDELAPVHSASPNQAIRWQDYALSVALVILVTLLGLPLRPYINPTNLVMLYLAAVMVAAVWLGRLPAIVASLLSIIVFDIVFVPPYYTLAVADAEYLLTFAGLLAVSLVIGTLVSRAQEQVLAARRRESQTAALFELSQQLASASGLKNIAQTSVRHVQSTFSSPAGIYFPDPSGERLDLLAATSDFGLEKDDPTIVDWVFRQGRPAGQTTDTLTNANGIYLPLQTSGDVIGVMGIEFPRDYKGQITGEQRYLLTSFSSQVALALEKARLGEQARRARLLEETEKLQSTLLNSISHDLRTPLASITGALSSLLDDADLLTQEAQHDLVFTAWEQALQLNRLLGNLLDMTRLESGAMKVVCHPYDIQELVGTMLAQMPNRLKDRTITRSIPNDLPPVDIDLTLMIQALMNLVDNALKYAPPEEPIDIEAYLEGQEVIITVKDRGPGLPEGEFEHIFSKFFRISPNGAGGTGLGLSIVRGIVEAHNGRTWAKNRDGGGAVFFIALPVAEIEYPEEEEF